MSEIINKHPTSDVAEVVRCCKCKNYEHMKQNNECFCMNTAGVLLRMTSAAGQYWQIQKIKAGEQE